MNGCTLVTLTFPKPALMSKANDPRKCGKFASEKVMWGCANRFLTCAIHTLGDSVQWITRDAHVLDAKGRSTIIRSGNTLESVTTDIQEDSWYQYCED